MRLTAAVDQFRLVKDASINSYEWYRKDANQSGKVSFGGSAVHAWKESGAWYVDDEQFRNAIAEYLEERAQIEKNTEDLRQGIVHTNEGKPVRTTFGGYRVRGDFYFLRNGRQSIQGYSDGTWYCISCHRPARLKHEKEECHRCRDWSSCEQSCTLSEVFCPDCGTNLKV